MKKFFAVFASLILCGGVVFASALSGGRDTQSATVNYISVGVATNTCIYQGEMVAVNSSGYLVAASDAASITVVGCANVYENNLTGAYGAGDNGAKVCQVKCGTFYWAQNDTSASSNKTAIGQFAYVVDNQTVSVGGIAVGGASLNHYVVAGIVVDEDPVSGQLAVQTGNFPAVGAGTPSTLAVVGAATVGTSLSVGTSEAVGTTLTVGATTTIHDQANILGSAFVSTNLVIAGTTMTTGVVTFTAIPVLAATASTNGGATATFVNSPATNLTPIWVYITGPNAAKYVMPLFAAP